MSNQVGSLIRKLREQRGVSQEAMAFDIGITQSNYGRLEKDDHRISILRLKKIAKILNIPVECLLKDSEDSENINIVDLLPVTSEFVKELHEEIAFLKKIIARNL